MSESTTHEMPGAAAGVTATAQQPDPGLAASLLAKTQAFGLNGADFAAQTINFLIVALLLWKFAYKPVLKALRERQARIAEGMANADKIKDELAHTQAERDRVLQQAAQQAQAMLEETRQACARLHEQGAAAAAVNAETIVTKARLTAEQEYTLMLNALRQEVGKMVVQAAIQVTGKLLTAEDQKRLTEETLKRLAA
ncbi:MAG: F0F1 ATP synthase subunit B [Lentisphaeria bacterium]